MSAAVTATTPRGPLPPVVHISPSPDASSAYLRPDPHARAQLISDLTGRLCYTVDEVDPQSPLIIRANAVLIAYGMLLDFGYQVKIVKPPGTRVAAKPRRSEKKTPALASA